ncbi:transporter substrate-binding domain-containing protein [Methanoculleus frigidifontis]|nr:transporter substrate-binding domain-containing protein [Methanoculleus sp. FWC-SCC1]
MKPIGAVLVLGMVVLACLVPGCLSPATSSVGESEEVSEDLVLVTEDYPPYNYVENGTAQGIAVDLLLEAFRETGGTISAEDIRVLPWSDAYRAALSQNNTVLFATVRLPERENLFKWAGPLGSERQVIFADPGSSIEIAEPGDLTKYRIGVVQDDAAASELLALGVNPSNLVSAKDVPALIALMQEGAIDLWCYGDLAGRHFTREVTGDAGYFEVVSTLDTRDLYYAFNKDTPDSVVETFQAALDTLRHEPDATGVTAYQRIVYRYIGVSCLSDPPVAADQVTGLVNLTAEALEADTPGTLARINAGEHPYWDENNRALYVFVYDTNTTIVAEADNPRLIGVNMKGKTDIAGTPFRDQITERALAERTGWVDYIWMIPEKNGIYCKSAYFRLVEGSDDNRYIVISGMYTPSAPQQA